MKTFQTEVVEKNRNTHSFFNNLYAENLREYGTARQATGDNITRHMRYSCRTGQEYAHKPKI